MNQIPKIKLARAIGDSQLLVTFENDIIKLYDCTPLFSLPQFRLIMTPAFFKAFKVDTGGYGISWNDNIDISEYELWTNGKVFQ